MIPALKRFFRFLISGDPGNQSHPAPPTNLDAKVTETSESSADTESRANHFTRNQILEDLVAHICSTMPDPRSPDEIDIRLHMYDAGYLTSITAADLLVHVDARYGIDISETQLIGPLQNLDALARYVASGR